MKNKNNKIILLVEDETILAMSQTMSLERYGYSVTVAATGEEAIEIIRSDENIDLILMDINLGNGMDGTQAAEIILKEYDIPVLFLSSHMEPEIVEKTEKISSYGYVVKSSSITVLDASIKMAFKLFSAHKEINQQNMLIKAGNENLNVTIEELETSKNRLTSVFRAAPTGIGVIINRNIIEVNQKICAMTGFEKEELIGKSARILYPTQDEYDFVGKEKYAQIKQNGTGTVETRWKCKDGRIIEVLLSSTPLDIYNLEKGVTFTALDITDRKQVERVLQESEEKFSKIFEGSSYPIMIIDMDDGCFYEVNGSALSGLEYAKDELIGRNAVELGILDPDAGFQTKKLIEESGEFSNFEMIVRTKSGKSLTVLASGQIILIKKHPYLMQTIMDITEKKQAEKALRENEEKWAFVMDGVPALLAFVDADLRLVYVNQAHADWYGKKKEEVIGISLSELLPEEAYKQALPNYRKVLNGEIITFDNKTYNRKGHEQHLDVRLVPHFKNGEVTGFFASLNDITDYKLTEYEMRNNSELLTATQQIAKTGGWTMDLESQTMHWTRETYLLHGFEPGVFESGSADYIEESIKCYEKKDQPVIREAFQQCVANGTPYDLDFLFTPINGPKIWIRTVAKPEIINGKIVKIIGSIMDITERRQAQDEIKKQLTEKEVLLKEVHHRIKNNIASIESLLTMQLQSITNPEAVFALKDAVTRIQGMHVLYNNLLYSNDYKEVSVKDYIEKLIEAIVTVFPESRKIEIEKQIIDFNLNPKSISPLGIIINELLTNTFKYAFKEKKSGHLSIVIDKKEDYVTLRVQDDGIGIDEDFDITESQGFGLTIVKILIDQLGGTFTIQNHNGTRSILRFPVRTPSNTANV